MSTERSSHEIEQIAIQERLGRVNRELTEATSQLKGDGGSGIYTEEYIDRLRVLVVPMNVEVASEALLYAGQHVEQIPNPSALTRDVLDGINVEYVVINEKSAFESYEMVQLEGGQRIQLLFFNPDSHFTYDEFFAHEAGHNAFDVAYNKTFGDFEVLDLADSKGTTHGRETDCSETYKEAVTTKIRSLFERHAVPLSVEDFGINRRKISEIFAFMIQREHARRMPAGSAWQEEHDKKVDAFLRDPKGAFANSKLDSEQARLDDIYIENHILSFLVVRLLEKEEPDFSRRMHFFNLKTEGLLRS